MAALVLIAAYFLKISRGEWIAVLFCIGMVLTAELINTAVENVVDLVTVKWHPLAALAKETAAGGRIGGGADRGCGRLTGFYPPLFCVYVKAKRAVVFYVEMRRRKLPFFRYLP